MRESSIEAYLIQEVKKLGGKCIKLAALFENGIPDRLVLLPTNKIYFVELKQKGKKPRKIQKAFAQKLSQIGVNVHVLDSIDAINNFLNDFK